MGFIKALHKQPVTVAFYVSNKFFNYSSGIIDVDDEQMCPSSVTGTNHAVLATGYGFDPDKKTGWIQFKNSWGSGWGDNGYFKFELKNIHYTAKTRGPCNLFRYGWKIISPKAK